jgi:hypothetical protein
LRNKCFFQVQISHVLHFISICDLFTESPHISTNPMSSHQYMAVSWLQQWNFLSEDMRISVFRKKNQKLVEFYGTQDSLCMYLNLMD